MLIQFIQRDLRISVPLQLDDDPHAFAVGLISDVRDAVYPLVLYQFSDLLDPSGFVYLKRDLCDDDLHASALCLFDLGL